MTTSEKVNHQTGRRFAKPISVQDYNDNKELVDQSAMQMPFSESVRKSLKQCKEFFFHLLDILLFNVVKEFGGQWLDSLLTEKIRHERINQLFQITSK